MEKKQLISHSLKTVNLTTVSFQVIGPLEIFAYECWQTPNLTMVSNLPPQILKMSIFQQWGQTVKRVNL